jgi:hypothetical protein
MCLSVLLLLLQTVPPRQFKSVEKYAEAARKAAAAFPSKVRV